jgi:hypothetical protein
MKKNMIYIIGSRCQCYKPFFFSLMTIQISWSVHHWQEYWAALANTLAYFAAALAKYKNEI